MNKPLVICLEAEKQLSDLDLLEQVCNKVRLGEIVKFHGKAYRRVTPKNNKVYKYPYHFYCCSENIYAGSFLTEDDDGEAVNTLCEYSAILKDGGN